MVVALCTGGEEPLSEQGIAWLDKAQYIIAADGGLRMLRRWGQVADHWIGDRDSLDGPWEDWAPWTKGSTLLNRDKDITDTHAALQYLENNVAVSEIWMLGGSGRRMDHWWSNWKFWEQEKRLSRWLTPYETAFALNEGQTWKSSTGVLSILPLGPGPFRVESALLRWPLDKYNFQDSLSLSNEAQEGAWIKSIQGRFLIVIPQQVQVLS